MFCNPVTAEEIIKIICKFPSNKAPGRDNINSKILKEISNYIVDSLVYIFNMSFMMGIVPDLLKNRKNSQKLFLYIKR